MPNSTVDHSPLPFRPPTIESAAVYCSDGRFVPHIDRFLDESLNMANSDRLVLPGGLGALADANADGPEAQIARERLQFLLEAHELQRIALIQHDDCGFYQAIVGVTGRQMADKQVADLLRLVRSHHQQRPDVRCEAYLARRHGDEVRFEAVALEASDARGRG